MHNTYTYINVCTQTNTYTHCMYSCTQTNTYTHHMYSWVYTSKYIHTLHVLMSVHKQIHTHITMYSWVYTNKYIHSSHVLMSVHKQLHTHITCTHECTQTNTYTHYMYSWVYTNNYIHTLHVLMSVHKQIHTHITCTHECTQTNTVKPLIRRFLRAIASVSPQSYRRCPLIGTFTSQSLHVCMHHLIQVFYAPLLISMKKEKLINSIVSNLLTTWW